MKLVLTGGPREPAEFILLEDATGCSFDDSTIFDATGSEIAQWSFTNGTEGWFPELFEAPEEFFAKAELRP